ncbi:MAG: PTS sugar transporter subunit IIB [Elusimicrobiota bacterium]|jgi:mannose/fructose/N-acetylgalactosamine-specific phosphotransferase system component IIB|nr:PTS sugar transporter subunit IIB [Elusimicrobiota bacterium]
MIILARVDDRLIHGQIVQGWLKSISIDAILVISDEAAKDPSWQLLMGIAVPPNIEFKVDSAEHASLSILNGEYDEKKLLLLADSPSVFLYLLKKGVVLDSLNVGGMHYAAGKKKILFNIYADEQDISDLTGIADMGVKIDNRLLPNDEKIDAAFFIKKYAGGSNEKN